MSVYSSSRASDASLADVLTVVQLTTLPARRRQEMASALRTIGRVLVRPLERVPANPRLLAIRLHEVSPRAFGISRGRWNNIRALARAALALVQPMLPGRQRNAISPAWKRLASQLRSRQVAVSLSRLLHYCSARAIDPDTVCNGTFEEFRASLSDTLLKDPDKVFVQTAKAWQTAQAEIEDWPRVFVAVPDRRKQWTLAWDRFPASLRQDFNQWRDRLAGRDILDEMPFRAVRETTLATREWQVRAFASALVHRGRDPATIRQLRDLVALETFKEGMRYFLDRNGNKRTAGIGSLTALMAIARLHVRVEPPQLERLVALSRRLAPDRRGGLTETNRARLRQLDDPGNVRALLLLPAALMRRAARNPDRRRGAIEAQLAVAIEILFMTAMRIGNLAQLDLDLNFVRPGRSNAVHIVIEAERVKNRESLEYPLPTQSAQILERYVQEFRPCLAPPSSSALFPARNGRPKDVVAGKTDFRGHLETHRLRINPHLFRHCGGKLFLECNPGGHEVVRRVLAHRSIDTTNSYYTGLQTAAAVRHFDETILKLRGDDRPPAPKP